MAQDILAQYEPFIQASAKKYGVDPELIKSIIMRESSGKADATTKTTSATGLMMLTDAHGLSKEDRLDPAKNIDAGTAYLASNLKAFGGDPQKALAGYYLGTHGAQQFYAGKSKDMEKTGKSVNDYLSSPYFKAYNGGLSGDVQLPGYPTNQPQTAPNVPPTQPALVQPEQPQTTPQQPQLTPEEQAAKERKANEQAKLDALNEKLKAQSAAKNQMYADSLNAVLAAFGTTGNQKIDSHTDFTNFYQPQWGAPTQEALETFGRFGTMANQLGQR